jgi:hypothetical protein
LAASSQVREVKNTNHLFNTITYFALSAVFLAAMWKVVKAYFADDSVKKQIKNFIFVCLFIGAAPGLLHFCSDLGKDIDKPLNAVKNQVFSALSNGGNE